MDDLIKYWFLRAVLILVWCVEAILETAIGFTATRGKSEERLLALRDGGASVRGIQESSVRGKKKSFCMKKKFDLCTTWKVANFS